MEIRINEPMKMHTSFRAGGPAAWYAEPETAEELGALVSLFQKAGLPWYIVGNGSNLLVSDPRGIRASSSAPAGLTGWRPRERSCGPAPACCSQEPPAWP